MLLAYRASAEVKLEREKIIEVLTRLEGDGWIPAVLTAQRAFLRQAGIEDLNESFRFEDLSRSRQTGIGDVFFRDAEIFAFRATHSEMLMRTDQGAVEVGYGEDAKIELAMVSELDVDPIGRWTEFATAVEQAVKESVDGRRARHMRFDWSPVAADPTGRLSQILKDTDEGEASFAAATLDAAQLPAARALGNDEVRAMLIEIAKAGFVRAGDLVTRWARRITEERANEILGLLKDTGLVSTKYHLICRADTSLTLTEFSDPAELDVAKDLPHPGCGRRFADELLEEGYMVSPSGRALVDKSHWMTVVVTESLVAAGIPETSIYWNMTEAGEEVDIVLAYLDEVWILELKARDFDSGDAYPFNYRRARYGPQRALIITTGSVTPEARRVFEELLRDLPDRARRSAAMQPIFIEGLANVDAAAQHEVAAANLAHASRHIAPLSAAVGYDLRKVLSKRLA